MNRFSKNLDGLLTCALLGAALSGCAAPTPVVRQGDKVSLSFDCRLPGGGLAVTTRPEAALAGETKSAIYLPRTGSAAVEFTAGTAGAANGQERIPFEQEVMQRLAPLTVGLKEGGRAQIALSAERFPVSSPNEKTVRLARVRNRPKELRLTPEVFRQQAGKDPAVGDAFKKDREMAGEVVEVSDREVVVRFTPAGSESLATPFGPAAVRELSDRYEIEFPATKGQLVRVGSIVGRIADVDDYISIDFGHPFGGDVLACDVEVVKVESPAAKSGTVGSAAVAVAGGTGVGDPVQPKQLEDGPTVAKAPVGKKAEEGKTTAVDAAVSGDLAAVHYTARLSDGTLVYSTRGSVADNPAEKKSPWFGSPKKPGPEPVAVGGRAVLPGVGEAVAGMSVGQKKRLELPPEHAFGPSDPSRMERLPLSHTMPRTITLPADQYVSRFGSFPTPGKEIPLTPYFPARVEAVREREVELALMVENGKSYDDPFGTTTVALDGENVVTTLKPVIGSTFPGATGPGVITRSDGTSFTVDTNNPLAGKTIMVELELASLTRSVDLPSAQFPWSEDHDAALARAKKEGKPAVLVLYADWCGFCKQLFGETIPDPRIRELRDRFAWIKVNSDKDAGLRGRYGQNGFPMVVLFNADGSLAVKLDGYQEASRLRAALEEVL